jgi:[ribosomal protein S5]-alanine N-acetyltransferase
MIEDASHSMGVWKRWDDISVRPAHDVEGDQLALRALDEAHANGPYLYWLRDKEVTRFLEARFLDYDIGRLRDYIRTENERPDSVLFGIFRLADGELIGTLKLSRIQSKHRNCDIGLMIGEKSEWGKGRGTEAISLACRYAFDTLKLHKVTAGCYADNLGSAQVFMKAGFALDGRLREDRLSTHGWVDCLMLSRLNPDDAASPPLV